MDGTGSPADASTNIEPMEEVKTFIDKHVTKHDDGSYGGYKEVDGKKEPIKLSEVLQEQGVEGFKAAAIIAEVRRRGSESSFTRLNRERVEDKAALSVYHEMISKNITIPEDVQEELDILKHEDPEKWRIRLNTVLDEAKKAKEEETSRLLEEAKAAALQEDSIETRQRILDEFNANTDKPLTDEDIQWRIPPILLKSVEDGKLTFKEMLSEAQEFIHGKKTTVYEKPPAGSKLGDLPGGEKPGITEDMLSKTYENTKY